MSQGTTAGFALPEMDPDLAGDEAVPGTSQNQGAVPEPAGPVLEPEPGTSTDGSGTSTDGSGTSPGGSQNQDRGSGAGSGTGPGNQAAGPAAGPSQRISVPGAAWLAELAWARRAAETHKRHRSFGHWLWNALFCVPPDTLSQYAGYIRSGAWLKDYMTGWLRTAATWEYRVFAVLIGGPLVQAGNSISRTGARQSRFWLTLAVALLALAIWLLRH